MNILAAALGLFIAAFLIHLIIWKKRVPRLQTNALLAIFFGTLGLGLVFLRLVFSGLLTSAGAYFYLITVYVPLVLSYIITYSALEVDSPSLVMLRLIDEAGKDGLDKERFWGRLNNDILVKPRLKDLLRDGFAVSEQGKYIITPKGRGFVNIFIGYRKLMGINAKGG